MDNSLSDKKSRLGHCCQEFLSQGQHHDRSGSNLIKLILKLSYVKISKAAAAINYITDHIQTQMVAIFFEKERKEKH